jgi:hypothetical protein
MPGKCLPTLADGREGEEGGAQIRRRGHKQGFLFNTPSSLPFKITPSTLIKKEKEIQRGAEGLPNI